MRQWAVRPALVVTSLMVMLYDGSSYTKGNRNVMSSWSRVLFGNSIPRDVLPGFPVTRGRPGLLCANAQVDLGPELPLAWLEAPNMASGNTHGWHA